MKCSREWMFEDAVAMRILPGLAKPGDTVADAERNVKTAYMYSEVVMKAMRARVEEFERQRQIEKVEVLVEQATLVLQVNKEELAASEEDQAELRRIVAVLGEEPKSEEGKDYLSQLRSCDEFIQGKRGTIAGLEAEIGKMQGDLATLRMPEGSIPSQLVDKGETLPGICETVPDDKGA